MTSPCKQEIERIARGLSEAALECFDGVRAYSMIPPYRAGASEILEAGLVRKDGRFFEVTKRGKAVRAYLQEQGE